LFGKYTDKGDDDDDDDDNNNNNNNTGVESIILTLRSTKKRCVTSGEVTGVPFINIIKRT